MSPIEPLRERLRHRMEEAERRPRPRVVAPGLHIGRAKVRPDTPSHTPGTQRGEEVGSRQPEAGQVGTVRNARSATAINPGAHGPIDGRMPHLPPA